MSKVEIELIDRHTRPYVIELDGPLFIDELQANIIEGKIQMSFGDAPRCIAHEVIDDYYVFLDYLPDDNSGYRSVWCKDKPRPDEDD